MDPNSCSKPKPKQKKIQQLPAECCCKCGHPLVGGYRQIDGQDYCIKCAMLLDAPTALSK